MSTSELALGNIGVSIDFTMLKTTFVCNKEDYTAIVAFTEQEKQDVWSHTFSKVTVIHDDSKHVLQKSIKEDKAVIDLFYRTLHVWAEGNLGTHIVHAKRTVTQTKGGLEYVGE